MKGLRIKDKGLRPGNFLVMILALAAFLSFSGIVTAQVKEYEAPRFFGKPMKAYVDSVTAHRIFTFTADTLKDQTLLKFKLEEDIEIERVSLFSQSASSGDTTGLYFLEGTLKIDSLVIPTSTSYKEFTKNITLTKDSSFVLIKLDDARWGGTVTGGLNAVFTVQYRVKRQ